MSSIENRKSSKKKKNQREEKEWEGKNRISCDFPTNPYLRDSLDLTLNVRIRVVDCLFEGLSVTWIVFIHERGSKKNVSCAQ